MTFPNLTFKGGPIPLPPSSRHVFDKCSFKADSRILVNPGALYVRFLECTFEPGSEFDLCDHHATVVMEACILPSSVYFLKGHGSCYIYIMRSSPDVAIPMLMGSVRTLIWDGDNTCRRWEIKEPFVIPRRVNIRYANDIPLRTRKSIDSLTCMLWRYPRLQFGSITWHGNPENYDVEFRNSINHPFRFQISILLALLGGQVLPRDLIRGGGLADFLMG